MLEPKFRILCLKILKIGQKMKILKIDFLLKYGAKNSQSKNSKTELFAFIENAKISRYT